MQPGETLCVVLCGGDNSTQQKDIERAKRLARAFIARAIGTAARAGGMAEVVREAGRSRENLCRHLTTRLGLNLPQSCASSMPSD